MSDVWRLDLPTVEKLVLLALADHADDDGRSAYPSVARLAYKTSLTPRSVQRVLRRLEDQNLIVAVAHASGGRGKATEYAIFVSAGEPMLPFDEWKQQAKGDTVSPITERVTDDERVTLEPERVTLTTVKGVTNVTPTIREPSVEPSLDTRRRCAEPLPTGAACPVLHPCWIHAPDLYLSGDLAKQTAKDGAGRTRRFVWEALALVCGLDPTGQTMTDAEKGRVNRAASQIVKVGGNLYDVLERATEYRQRWQNVDMTPTALSSNWSQLATPRPTGARRSISETVAALRDAGVVLRQGETLRSLKRGLR